MSGNAKQRRKQRRARFGVGLVRQLFNINRSLAAVRSLYGIVPRPPGFRLTTAHLTGGV